MTFNHYLLAGADLQSVPSLYREARIANPRQQGTSSALPLA